MSERKKVIRKQFLVDKSIQIPLLVYSLAMASIGLALASLFTVFWISSNPSPGESSNQILLFLVVSFLAIVGMLYFGIILTNRVAGPLVRLKKHMESLSKGENPPPLSLRKGDFLNDDFIDMYNHLVDKLNRNP